MTIILNETMHIRDEMVDNVSPWVWLKADTVTFPAIKEDWENYLKPTLLKNVTDWSLCIQAGGCMGMYPKLLSFMFEEVVTLEPDSSNYNCLIANSADRNNITSHNLALGAYKKTVELYHPFPENPGQNLISTRDRLRYSGQVSEVEMITIDNLNVASCGLIMLDIEKYELFAILGAIKTIETFKPVIICEYTETTNNTINALLAELGYALVDKAQNDSVFKYDGTIPEKYLKRST